MPEPANAGRMLGRYVLFQAIAKGGMASVHLGRLLGPVGFARTVAIKRLHEHLATDPEFVRMFLEEARLAARIQHPNVVATLDVVAEQTEVFLVLEYVHGESLGRLIRTSVQRGQPIPLAVALTIISGMLSGLHAAHEAKSEQGIPMNLVHRDVSPQNVLVGADGIARVLDFGVAKAQHRLTESTGDGRLKGKLAYMAPEQLKSKPVDRRADIFAASVVAWELLTGHRLFANDEPGSVVMDVLEKRVVPPSRIVPGLPAALDAIVLQGLARAPGDRFATAEQMALEIESVARNASTREIGAWVADLAREVLAERAGIIERVEKATEGATPVSIGSGLIPLGPGTPPVAPTPELASASQATHLSHAASLRPEPRRPLRLAALALGAVALLALGAGGMYWLVGRPAPEDSAVAAITEPSTVAPGPEPAPPSPEERAREDAGSPPAPESVSTAATATRQRVATTSPKTGKLSKPAATSKPACKVPASCQPPWTVDSSGKKKFKPECASYLSCLE